MCFTLIGQSGIDTLTGDGGDDTFQILSGGDGNNDTFVGGAGSNDTIQLSTGVHSLTNDSKIATIEKILTDSGGTPTLQLHDANESIASDGSKVIITSGGTAFSLPTSDGSNGQVLTTDGSGTLSFTTVSGGGGSTVGISTTGSSFFNQLNVSGVSTFANSVRISGALPDFTVDSGTFRYDGGKLFLLRSGEIARYYSGTPSGSKGPHVFYTHVGGSNVEMLRLNGDTGATLVGVMTATSFSGDGSNLTGVNANIGISTHAQGSFTASAGSPATINTYAYGSSDVVVEYTIYIQNGSSSQTQKL